MGLIDLSTYKPVVGTDSDANLIRNAFDTLQTLVNGNLDNNNMAAAAGMLLSKLGQSGATTWQVPAWDGSAWVARSGASIVIVDDIQGGSGNTIDFQSIPATFKTLLVRGTLRGTTAAANVVVVVRFNADATGTYDYETLVAANAAVTSTKTDAAAGFQGNVMPAANARANRPGFFELVIPQYAGTTFEKTCELRSGYHDTTAAASEVRQVHGAWRSTAAITRVQIISNAGNWAAGSQLTLYGIS